MSMRAVILAGGRGARLAPYTAVLPKPLMPIGDMPVLELLIRRLALHDIGQVTLAVGHLSSLIRAYFRNEPERFGVSIDYSQETEPLGTAGPLSMIDNLNDTFLVMNGDLLTDLDFGAMIAFHREHQATATIGVYERDVPINLGVIQTDTDRRVIGYVEKPVYHYEVSMGVYVLEPKALSFVPQQKRFDLPDLIRAMLAADTRVLAYRHTGYWLDIGRPDDYQQAQEDFPKIREKLLGRPEGHHSAGAP